MAYYQSPSEQVRSIIAKYAFSQEEREKARREENRKEIQEGTYKCLHADGAVIFCEGCVEHTCTKCKTCTGQTNIEKIAKEYFLIEKERRKETCKRPEITTRRFYEDKDFLQRIKEDQSAVIALERELHSLKRAKEMIQSRGKHVHFNSEVQYSGNVVEPYVLVGDRELGQQVGEQERGQIGNMEQGQVGEQVSIEPTEELSPGDSNYPKPVEEYCSEKELDHHICYNKYDCPRESKHRYPPKDHFHCLLRDGVPVSGKILPGEENEKYCPACQPSLFK